MEDSLGKEISRKVEKGYLKGCSVGIHIKKMSDTDEGLVATEVEVLEASIVAVPSDANAVSLYDENSKPTTIETVKLNFNCNYNKNQMDKKMELTAKTLESLGLDDSATAKIIELAVVAKDTKITELEGKVSAFEKQKVNDLINQAIADKKISADEKSTYIGLAEKDYAGVKKILDKMQGVSPVSGQLKQQGVSSKYEGKTWDELDRAGLLASLKAEAPELYNQLYKNKFNIQ
jgi:hypothetical protein